MAQTLHVSDFQDQLMTITMQTFNIIDDYVTESNLIDLEQLKQSPNFGRKRYVDAFYFGELENSKRFGKGVMKYKNGRVYEGSWYQDLRSGMGYEKYQNGNVYVGQFAAGKTHGQGHYTWVAS